ncbi:outer membrane protein transport protein [Sulfurimonas sp.]|uniref:OmpP1/FadL family transporter n=1 Tax=Sulfurimonas sp. TaxID=2022749 RepID=UPI002606D800|nr:outer membrane protein transport protein [Sulfurimonas sp.]
MRNIIKVTTLSLVAAGTLYAGGYKIPETSLNAIALSAANVAHSHGAENAYSNPANMVFMENKQNIEADLIYIGLDPVRYKSNDGKTDINAKKETFLLPSLHYVSKKLGNNARVGLSIVVPGGLSKRWNDSPAVEKAKEFTLKVIEINPSAAFKINDKLGVAVGFRIVSTTGIVKSSAAISRDMTGDSIDMGYNLALAYKPTKALEIGLTYRSNVDLTVEGNAKLYIGNAKVYDGGSSVTVPLPATIDAAVAYTFPTQTTVEFVYERVNWSAYKNLDFNYVSNSPTILKPYFDDPIAKEWKDTNVYRLGITQQMEKYTLMAGAVKDESPVPNKSLGFELPDSDSVSVSGGVRYQYSKNLNVGFAALYSMRDTRKTTNDNDVDGEFSNSNVLIMSAGLGYKF